MNEVLTLKESSEWNILLNRLPLEMQDIHFTPEYYAIQEKNGYGKAFCFCFEKNEDLALYPFMLNSVNDLGYDLDDQYYDIQGASGYNGVAFNSLDKHFIFDFYNVFDKYCITNNIIADFTRFNPVLNNQKFCLNNYEVLLNRNVVLVNLEENNEVIETNNYSGTNRNKIRKAIKKGIEVIHLTDLDSYIVFHKIFIDLMNFLKAETKYHYTESFFSDIFYHLINRNILMLAYSEGTPIGGAMALFNGLNSHYFLAAVLPEFRKSGINNLLLDELIKFLKSEGFKTFNLGGGKTVFPSDSLLRFKMSFSHDLANFYIGKRVILSDIYKEVVRQWKEKSENYNLSQSSMLLGYRSIN